MLSLKIQVGKIKIRDYKFKIVPSQKILVYYTRIRNTDIISFIRVIPKL